jgi:hypothetical protein
VINRIILVLLIQIADKTGNTGASVAGFLLPLLDHVAFQVAKSLLSGEGNLLQRGELQHVLIIMTTIIRWIYFNYFFSFVKLNNITVAKDGSLRDSLTYIFTGQ